jgi:DNA repair photolyase
MAETLSVKSNALNVLEKQLKSRSAKSQYGFVAVGSATDAYMPHENNLRMTEGMLKLLQKYRFPVFISTKRQLITRDIEILKQIDQTAIIPLDLRSRLKNGLILSVSISTMNERISNMLEPGACTPGERLQLLKQLKEQGFLVGVNAIPILPFISDSEKELEEIISGAAAHGADYIWWVDLLCLAVEMQTAKPCIINFLSDMTSRSFQNMINCIKRIHLLPQHTIPI